MSKPGSRRRSCLDKRLYWTEQFARQIADDCERRGSPPLRVYKCDYCPGYHLTKQIEEPVDD